MQATVTVDGRHSPATSDAGEDDDGEGAGSNSAEGAESSSSFMCTPQSFPPTPVSRAHVMARTSQFADDVLFLARDQLRLGENLKPGMDETVRIAGFGWRKKHYRGGGGVFAFFVPLWEKGAFSRFGGLSDKIIDGTSRYC